MSSLKRAYSYDKLAFARSCRGFATRRAPRTAMRDDATENARKASPSVREKMPQNSDPATMRRRAMAVGNATRRYRF